MSYKSYWGKQSKAIDPSTNRAVKLEQPPSNWVAHFEGKQMREDLTIISIDTWTKVQALIKESTRVYNTTASKLKAMEFKRQNGVSSEHLLTGILKCSECGTSLLQITGRKGGYYGCPTHHRTDAAKCGNRRMMNRLKIERSVITAIRESLESDLLIKRATDLANDIVKRKMRQAPAVSASRKAIKNAGRRNPEFSELHLFWRAGIVVGQRGTVV